MKLNLPNSEGEVVASAKGNPNPVGLTETLSYLLARNAPVNSPHNSGLSKCYIAIRDSIKNLYRELNTGDYDRAEMITHGYQIRCWRTKINCCVQVHLGYKSSWQTDYQETTVDELTEILLARDGAVFQKILP